MHHFDITPRIRKSLCSWLLQFFRSTTIDLLDLVFRDLDLRPSSSRWSYKNKKRRTTVAYPSVLWPLIVQPYTSDGTVCRQIHLRHLHTQAQKVTALQLNNFSQSRQTCPDYSTPEVRMGDSRGIQDVWSWISSEIKFIIRWQACHWSSNISGCE